MILLKGAKAIMDPDVYQCLHLAGCTTGPNTLFDDPDKMHLSFNKDKFITTTKEWIQKSTLFKFKGLEEFKYAYITIGNTQAIEEFYRLSNGRVYTFPGEYPYHTSFKENHRIGTIYGNWKPEPAGPYIKHGAVLSHPFAATGNEPTNFDERMRFLDDTNVMLDFAYFGVYYNPEPLDLTQYPQVHSVAFSLSKVFCTGFLRVGIVLSKTEWDSPLKTLNEWSYLPVLNMRLHELLMKKFDPDYIYEKYRKSQLEMCKELDLTPSDTVLFGLSDDSKWDEYTRNGIINRICLGYALTEHK